MRRTKESANAVGSVGKKLIDKAEDMVGRLGLIRDKYIKTYIKKEWLKTGSLDYILCDMLSIEYADDVIEAVFDRMNRLGFYVEEYRPIIYYNFLLPTEMADEDILLEINLSRSSYYRKKKEAITLFGILLWTEMLERCELAANM